jgi:hypothetical protein
MFGGRGQPDFREPLDPGAWPHRTARDLDHHPPQRLPQLSGRRPGLRHRTRHRHRENHRQAFDRNRLRPHRPHPGQRRCRGRLGLQPRSLDRREQLPLSPRLELGRGPLHHPHWSRSREHHRLTPLRHRCHQGELPRYGRRHHPTLGTQRPPDVRLPGHDRKLPPPLAGTASDGGLERISRASAPRSTCARNSWLSSTTSTRRWQSRSSGPIKASLWLLDVSVNCEWLY